MVDSAMIEVAPMVPADIPAVLEIEESSNPEPWREESFLEELDRSHSRVWVAHLPGTSENPVGFICYWMVSDELHVLNLAVHHDFRRRGIGRHLLHQALAEGCHRGLKVAVLEVRQSNRGARMLYENAGFRQVGKRPDYYGVVREPAIIMELDLEAYCRPLAK